MTDAAELRLLRETLREIFGPSSSMTAVDAAVALGWDEPLWRRLEAAGLTLVGQAEATGGSGGDLAHVAEVVAAAATACAVAPIAERLVATEFMAAAGLPVPDGLTGLVLGVDTIRVEHRGQSAMVTGVAARVPYGRILEHLVVVGADSDGEYLVVVPASAVRIARAGVNLAGEPRDDVVLSGEIPVSAYHRLAVGSARSASRLLDLSRTVALAAVAARVLTQTVEYVGQREQFGRPLARQQAVQQEVAHLAGEVELMAAAATAAVGAWTRSGNGVVGASASFEISAAKAQASTSASAVAAIAHQLHGAIGTTHEHTLRLLTTRLWSWRDEGTPTGRLLAEIGRLALATGGPQLWTLLAHEDTALAPDRQLKESIHG
jgi:acyl-CoA dehydrogenase